MDSKRECPFPVIGLLLLFTFLLLLCTSVSQKITIDSVPSVTSTEETSHPSLNQSIASPFYVGHVVVNASSDYLERRRRLDTSSGNNSAAPDRKIFSDIFESVAGESEEDRSERLQQMQSWLSDRDPTSLSNTRLRVTSLNTLQDQTTDSRSTPQATQALPLKSGPFLVPQILVSPVYAPVIGSKKPLGSARGPITMKAEESRIDDEDTVRHNQHPTDDHRPDHSDDLNDEPPPYETGPDGPGTSKTPPCGHQGRFYCSYKEDYPVKVVTEVTRYYKWPLEKLFRDLRQQVMPKLANDNFGGLVCDSITRVVRPGWARNTNNKWLVVINTDQYQQFVTEVICRNGAAAPCNFIPPCYAATCSQRYNTQKLLVVDPWNPYKGPFLSEFLFPSCCICYVPTTPHEAASESRIKSDHRQKREL